MANKPLLGLEIAAKRGSAKALRAAAKLLEEKIQENVSLEDHSLADLAALDHPYSSEHPKILHDPSYQVHVQDGDLRDAVKVVGVNQYLFRVGVDETKAPHVVDVIFGTRDMVARDFLTSSFHEVEQEMLAIFAEEITKEIK